MMDIKIRQIGDPKKNTLHEISLKVKRNMTKTFSDGGDEAKRLLDQTVEHWGSPAVMVKRMDTSGAEIVVDVGPVGYSLDSVKWYILDIGYDRMDKMKPTFVRKTHPRTLRTNMGTIPSIDGVAYRANEPIAHVDARQWSRLAMLLMRRWLRTKARKAIKDSL